MPTDEPIHILHVDDEPDFVDLTATFLAREDARFTLTAASDVEDGLAQMRSEQFDCVVSDHDMPDRDGIEFLQAIREEHAHLPVILFTGKGSEEVASEAISKGVTDYLQKGRETSQFTVLANRIRNAVEQHRARVELADREKRLNLFFEQSPFGVIRWDDEFRFARINDTAQELLGYDADELIGESWRVIVPEEEYDAVENIVGELLDNTGGFNNINQNVRSDGKRILCKWHNRVVTGSNGEVVAVFSQFWDITEERELQRELERHRAIHQAANNTIIAIGEDNLVQSVNPAVEDTFGYAPDDVIGEPLTILMSERIADRHQEAFSRYLETGTRTLDWDYVEMPGQHRDGTSIPLSLSYSEVIFEGERLFLGIVRDISERTAQEAKLRRQQAFIDKSLDSLEDVFFVLREDGGLSYWNQRVADVTGYTKEEIEGIPINEFFADEHEERIYAAIEEALETGSSSVEADVCTKAGTRIPYEFRGTRMMDPTGSGRAVAGVGRNISLQRRQAVELERVSDLLEYTERIADVAGWEIDAETKEIRWSNNLANLLGIPYSANRTLDEALDVYNEEDRKRVEQALNHAFETGEPFDIEAKIDRPDGGTRWVRIQCSPVVEKGDIVTLRGAIQDITELRQPDR